MKEEREGEGGGVGGSGSWKRMWVRKKDPCVS